MAEQRDSKKTYHALKARFQEGITSYSQYDGSNRVQFFYEGPIGVQAGDLCLVTEFKYVDGAGGTSRLVLATEERITNWPAVDFSALP